MSFFDKYELVRLLREGEVKTFRALERSTGRQVLFHMLTGETQGRLLDRVRRLEGRPQLIEIGEFANAPYVVTEYAEGITSLEEWLEQQPPPADIVEPASESAPAAPFQSNLSEPGEFTRLFGSARGMEGAEGKPVEPEPLIRDTKDEPGEFTRLFLGAEPSPVRPSPPPAPLETPAEPDWPQAGSEPGDFTRFFGPGIRGEPINIEEEHARQAASPGPAAAPFQQAGEFTRRFGRPPDPKGERIEPATDSGLLSTSSDLLGFRKKPPATEPEAGEKPPGEYTRVIRLGENTDETKPQETPQPAPLPEVAPTRRRWVVPVLVGTATILVAVLVLLVLVWRKSG
jgi:hypothetical protein